MDSVRCRHRQPRRLPLGTRLSGPRCTRACTSLRKHVFIRLLIRLGLQMSSARLLLAPRTHVLLLAYTRLTEVLYELKPAYTSALHLVAEARSS